MGGGGRRGRGALAFLTPSLSFGMFDISVSFRRKRMKTTDRTLTKEVPQEVCFFFCKFLVCHKRCSELQCYCFNFVLVLLLVYCVNTPNSQSFIYHFMGLFGTNIVTNPLGLFAQLVEHFTGIAEVMGSNPIQVWMFFRPYFHYCF